MIFPTSLPTDFGTAANGDQNGAVGGPFDGYGASYALRASNVVTSFGGLDAGGWSLFSALWDNSVVNVTEHCPLDPYYISAQLSPTILETDTKTKGAYGIAAGAVNYGQALIDLEGLFGDAVNHASNDGIQIFGAWTNAFNEAGAEVSNAKLIGYGTEVKNDEPSAEIEKLYGLNAILSLNPSASYGDVAGVLVESNYSGGDIIRSELNGTENFGVGWKGEVRLHDVSSIPDPIPNGVVLFSDGGVPKVVLPDGTVKTVNLV